MGAAATQRLNGSECDAIRCWSSRLESLVTDLLCVLGAARASASASWAWAVGVVSVMMMMVHARYQLDCPGLSSFSLTPYRHSPATWTRSPLDLDRVRASLAIACSLCARACVDVAVAVNMIVKIEIISITPRKVAHSISHHCSP